MSECTGEGPYCELCGDCLFCYGESPCYGQEPAGEHQWPNKKELGANDNETPD